MQTVEKEYFKKSLDVENSEKSNFEFIDLGDVADLTKLYADGGNKDGGYIPGHNWAYN